jgi:Stress responsive A/B Barrel Domain
MRRLGRWALALAAGAMMAAGTGGQPQTGAAPAAAPMIGHMVYFTLTDNSPAKVKELVAACDKYLSKHPGEAFYGCGPRAKTEDRDVVQKDWDVGLQMVFKTMADYEKYATAPRHEQFIAEQKANWKAVKVYDTELPGK